MRYRHGIRGPEFIIAKFLLKILVLSSSNEGIVVVKEVRLDGKDSECGVEKEDVEGVGKELLIDFTMPCTIPFSCKAFAS